MSVANVGPKRPSRPGHARWLAGGTAVALMLAVGACKKEQPVEQAAAPGAAAPVVAPPAQAVSAKVAAMSADELRAAAGTALAEQRLYAPAADNAMEYYLALRDKQPSDPSVASALTDLMPYALIATEQSIARDDFVEAQRLFGLMEKADKQAPALPRLKTTIASAQASLAERTAAAAKQTEEDTAKQLKLEAERVTQQQAAQQQAAQQLAATQAEARQAEQAAAAQRAADQRAADERAASQRAAQQAPAQAATRPAATQAATPAASASSELRAISTPAPRYPTDALRSGQSGEVQVEFTVSADGSVSNARVVRATPPRVFDREAVAAVRKWRFQPVSAPVTTRRTIGFSPGN